MKICTNLRRDLYAVLICSMFYGGFAVLTALLLIGEADYITLSICGAIVCLLLAILVSILFYKSKQKEEKIIKRLVKYRNFMVATNQYTITAIVNEFDEHEEDVEKFIQNAIDQGILRNVYLSKKTKELLLIHKKPAFNKAKVNQQNVNVENNVIINDNVKQDNI